MQTVRTEKAEPPSKATREVSLVLSAIESNIATNQRISRDGVGGILKAADIIKASLRDGHKVVFFGNGGSAADAQHLAAEFVGRFKVERTPLRSIALTANPSVLTAIGNDFSFEEIFSRQVSAAVEQGDTVVGISTSGRSRNVLNGIREAHRLGAITVGLTGSNGKEMASMCDHAIVVPSNETQRVQEAHLMIGHIICELVEAALAG
jgi:D-sedoheptulose 7-phosphate isomerase